MNSTKNPAWIIIALVGVFAAMGAFTIGITDFTDSSRPISTDSGPATTTPQPEPTAPRDDDQTIDEMQRDAAYYGEQLLTHFYNYPQDLTDQVNTALDAYPGADLSGESDLTAAEAANLRRQLETIDPNFLSIDTEGLNDNQATSSYLVAMRLRDYTYGSDIGITIDPTLVKITTVTGSNVKYADISAAVTATVDGLPDDGGLIADIPTLARINSIWMLEL